ncbi:MAG: phosphonate ABC transporter substrate-binding protein [Hyphomicrobiaceae bacterium]
MKTAKTLSALAFAALSAVGVSAMPAAAEDLKVFNVGILGGENEADRLRNWGCVQEQLGKTLGVEVKLFPAADYDGVVQGLLGGTLDYADLGASGFAKIYLANEKAVDPILVTVQTDGSMGYHTVLIARSDSGIAKIEDLKGKTLAFADPDSTSGYLIPLTQLPKAVGGELKDFFSKTDFAGGHEQVVQAVLDKKFDAGTTWSSVVGDESKGYTSGQLTKSVEKGQLNMKDIVILWKSDVIPNGPSVLRSSLPDDVKAKVKDYLMNLPKTDAACFKAIEGGDFQGFADIPAGFYEGIIAARKAKIGG